MNTTKRILLIDDDEDDCFFFGIAIEKFDYPIEFLFDRDSEAAVNKLRNQKEQLPDLLFLDWNMPRLTGRDCLFALRSIPWLSKVPIIIYTTSRSREDQDEAKRLGASYFLSKPSSIGLLYKKLNELIAIDWTSQTVN